MAGVRGRSGGARPGAGRKPKPTVVVDAGMAPLEFLRGVMVGAIDARPEQLKAAIAAARYMHAPPTSGVKAEAAERAKKAGSGGRFGARTAPPLALIPRAR